MRPDEVHKKPSIAMIAMGVIGTGTDGQGIPAITELTTYISKHANLTYYTLQSVDQRKIPASITVRQIVSWRIPGRVKYFLLMLRLIADHFKTPHQLFYAIGTFPTGQWGVLLGKIFRRPVVIHLLGLEASGLTGSQYSHLIWSDLHKITLKVCRQARSVIVLTEYQKHFARKVLTTKHDLSVIPLGINIEKFPFIKRGISYPVKFVHVAYSHPVKDQQTLFRCFARIASQINCELKVIGNGFDNPQVKSLLEELKISEKVIFSGTVKNSELVHHFRDVHIMLHTSLFESQCVVALEAMASGIPVCSTRVGIFDDLGEAYFGLSEPGDYNTLAVKALLLVTDPERYETIQMNAFQWVTSHDSNWSGEKYLQVFEQCIESA